MPRISFRFDFDEDRRLGPGKVALLEAVRDAGAISTAARTLGMSYRRAWLLVEAMNGMFKVPVVQTAHGGPRGGGAALTPFGAEVVSRYRATESRLHEVAKADLQYLQRQLDREPRDL